MRTDYSRFDRWIDAARLGALQDGDIAQLAADLAGSGEKIARNPRSADLASTGGPGSISTLWAPPALVALGATVAKLGVPGRPAGGIDTLMQLDGYRADFGASEAEAVIHSCGYVHLLAGAKFAPDDAALFSHRQKVGAQSIPELAIASLLSKKLATGTAVAGLEVRIAAHGNFGADRSSAAQNAVRFCRVARMLDIEATCFLVDATVPQQPYLGRGEALLALSKLMRGTQCDWLDSHASECEAISARLLKKDAPARHSVGGAFGANLTSQGAQLASLHERAEAVRKGLSRDVRAGKSGVIHYDIGALRNAILAARHSDRAQDFDDTAGLYLVARPGTFVRAGEEVVFARCPAAVWQTFEHAIKSAIAIGSGPPFKPAELEVVSV